ncbi:MAG: SdpI family protein [Oscillospiraceae bacterium]|nr:SdpI family protein [Oscillospiraceae bacterium]
MIKKYKWGLLISSLVILLPALLGLIFWNKLPQPAFMGVGSKLFLVAGMPLILLGFQWLCVLLSAKDIKGADQSKKVVNMVLWIIPVLSLFIAGVFFAASVGKAPQIAQYSLLLFAVFFVVLGNYLPKCKQSFTTGIKIKWTLANEENWYATHRMAGKLWMLGGVLLVPCVFLPIEIAFAVFFVLMLIMILVPTIYSWRYYKKQVAEGRAPEKPEIPMTKNMKSVRNGMLTIVGLVLVGLMLFVFVFAGFELRYDATSFTVDATGFSDTTVNYQDITAIEYRQSCKAGVRTYGFGDVPVQMGVFTNDEFGSYTRFGYPGSDAAVVLHVDGEVLVLTGKNTEQTRKIYDELLIRIGEK